MSPRLNLGRFFQSRLAGWILLAFVAFFFILFVVAELAGYQPSLTITKTFWGNKTETKNESSPLKDPLGIEGAWTYQTFFDNDPTHHEYRAVKGINFDIKFNGCGYTMQGRRTHYMPKNSNAFQEYSNPIPINISRTSYSPDLTKFYFYFQVQGTRKLDQSEGFVELQVDKSKPSKMVGTVHYLYSDGTWSRSEILFDKQ